MKDLNRAVDINFLRGIIGNDVEFERELFRIFLRSVTENSSGLRSSIINEDNELWYKSAHAMRGSAALIGAFDLASILEEAQSNSKNRITRKNKILKRVEKELDLVMLFMEDVRSDH